MSKEVNILIIAEGIKTEKNFLDQINNVFGTNFNIFCYGTNIYGLYKRMKELDFNCDISSVLLELPEDPQVPNRKDILSKKFAYTYLIFDFDAHHTEEYEKYMPINDIVKANTERLKEMLLHFTNETDPTIGKLYVNYPMMESFRDADSFFDDNYENDFINISDICNYKRIVGTKKLCNTRIDRYSKEDFNSLALMNIYKLSKLTFGNWSSLKYDIFREQSEGYRILEKQEMCINSDNNICVLNTALFLLIDYYGNQNGFYDSLIK